jgi:hypothetical protein
MADINKIIEELSKLTVFEAAELVKALEAKWREPNTSRLTVASAPATAGGVADNQSRSLPRLRQILGDYYQPVLDHEAIGNRVPFPTLTRRINEQWNLTGDRKFQNGEINAGTVVIDLAREIDFRAGL